MNNDLKALSIRFIAPASASGVPTPFDWDRTQQGIALGVSGDPRSPHRQNQRPDWHAATPRALPFTHAAVARSAQLTHTLVPK